MATRAERKAQRRALWQSHFDSRARSGLSVQRYAAEHGLCAQTYYGALKRYGHDRQPTSADTQLPHSAGRFARVVTAPASASRTDNVRCRIELASGTRLELEGWGAHFESALRAMVSLG